jgi:carbon storage regulator
MSTRVFSILGHNSIQQGGAAMLVLTRRTGETVYLGENIKLTMVKVRGGQVRLAIDAPRDVSIRRGEIPGRLPVAQAARA